MSPSYLIHLMNYFYELYLHVFNLYTISLLLFSLFIYYNYVVFFIIHVWHWQCKTLTTIDSVKFNIGEGMNSIENIFYGYLQTVVFYFHTSRPGKPCLFPYKELLYIVFGLTNNCVWISFNSNRVFAVDNWIFKLPRLLYLKFFEHVVTVATIN